MDKLYTRDELTDIFKSFSLYRNRKPRKYQIETIQYIVNSKSPVVVLRADTGSGKTIIGATACKVYNDSTYLVHSKSLQDQVEVEHPEFSILKGRSNYPCVEFKGKNCAECQYKKPRDECESYHRCKYILQKRITVASDLRILNYSYFLTEANYVGEFSKNMLLVCDEADTLKDELLSHVKLQINERQIRDFNLGMPTYKTACPNGVRAWRDWAKENYITIKNEYKKLCDRTEEIDKETNDRYKSILNKLSLFSRFVDDTWIYQESKNRFGRIWSFSPTWITPEMTDEFLRRHVGNKKARGKIILMSAKLPPLPILSQELGIPMDEIDFLETPSVFDPSKRKQFLRPVADMSTKNGNYNVADVSQAVNKIINKYSKFKGLIHTVNYRLRDLIMEHCNDSGRMITHNTANRNDIINQFKASSEPLVLVSPSCDRGLSLNDDLARFLILMKCFKGGTRVVMSDGKLKNIENITNGESVMGIDGKPRLVSNTVCGYGKLYNVKQRRGAKDYTVSEGHILTLKKKNFFKKLQKRKRAGGNTVLRLPYPKWEDIVKITVENYIKMSDGWKYAFGGYKIAIDFPIRDVTIDPYFLGLWLGDGDSDCVRITTADVEIEEYIYKYAAENKLTATLGVQKIKAMHIKRIYIGHVRGVKNNTGFTAPIKNLFRKYNLFNNKHIPDDYIYNSRNIRLKILAGIIDTDGTLHADGTVFSVTQKNRRFANQICYIANSLGLRCSIRRFKGAIKKIGFSGMYYVMTISGKIEKIPTRIKRKQAIVCTKGRKRKDPNISGISVENAGYGAYYGISINEDSLFLLEDFTVVHNCPYPDLSDKMVQAKLYSPRIGKYWYKAETAQTIEQQVGRGVRSSDDWCDCFILDTKIEELIVRHREMFSKHFLDCLVL